MIFKDQLNREIVVDTPPQRIISLVPSLTELLCDLGLTKSIQGVTKFCIHPKNIRNEATVIGGTKKINLAKCMDLNPDFVLVSKEENIEHQVMAFAEKGINVYVSDIKNHGDLEKVVSGLGKIFNLSERAESLNADLNLALERIEESRLNKSIKAMYLIWKNPYMAAGGDTYISYMLNKIGIQNSLEEKNRYPNITQEELKRNNSDVILLSSEPYPFKELDANELREKTGKKVILVDGEFFSWYGSRILHLKEYPQKLTSQL